MFIFIENNMIKIVGIAFLLASFGIGVYAWKAQADDEIYILPDNYRGVVFVLYDQKNGEPLKYEQGKRVYEIPPNGILKAEFSLNTGWHHPSKFFYKKDGELTEVPYDFRGTDLEVDKVQVCCESSGRFYRNDNHQAITLSRFSIGTKEEIHIAGEKAEKIHIADLMQ